MTEGDFSDSLPPENVFGHRKKLDFLRRQISEYVNRHPDRKCRILDIGCSNGQYVTIHLADLGADILAIDLHEPSIQYAIENNPHPDVIEFQCTAVENLPSDEKFDIVVMADILEHLSDPAALLESVKSRLIECGIILASIPNGFGPFEIENGLDRRGCLAPLYRLFTLLSRLKGKLRGRKAGSDSKTEDVPYAYECGHVQFWTMGGFRSLLRNHGLVVTEWRKGSWVGALCTSTWWGRSEGFCRWNAGAGDYLPAWAVSAWYFRIEAGE